MSDEVVIVTGGTRGIGRATAEAFAERQATVIATYYSDEEAATDTEAALADIADHDDVDTWQFDVGDYEAVSDAIGEIASEYGQPTVLVNNAGIMSNNLLIRMDPDEWEQVLRTNVTGTFNCTRSVARQMLRGDGGAIVNVASVAAQQGWAGQSNYAASKAAIVGFTRSIASELGDKSIRVNAVAPGYTRTDLYSDHLSETQEEIVAEETASGEPASPADIAEAILFLASDRASYVHGEVLRVDDGLVG
ncbi:SDR family NAD(P)-dependent oxidoreductase [Haloarcula salinisoli]|uniref:3-oxoacyl-ACP reductase FabG n=1 Tax=Haloarcula salinisoli TaxID=2487746 RepID=A0A8J8C9Y0_9EURY|nr:3-oxoacyl-ACP reductase family protein [Halomicroarcula salinisoli]MBX0288651.1 3-oxoacyl-ACP reductase FabG [Halomicroarcula salinisoli]MBX0306056.1 3-oxoacyl-ACP reductase FabG [Halomicroarcula salinisoli]